MFSRRALATIFVGMATFGAGPAFAQPARNTPAPMTVPPGKLVVPGKTPDLTLFFTGDVIGYLDPCG